MMHPLRRLVLVALAALVPAAAVAQQWPARPIKLIIPYPPGGQTDIISRWLADKLTPVLGQPVVPENRAGAQGSVGLQAAKNSPPDGYTFVYTNVSNISINPHIQANLPYDGLKDFATVTQLGLSVLAMVVPTSLNIRTLPEFIEHAKRNAGKVSFASFGNGSSSHVYGEMLKGAAGIEMTHVAYKGAGPAVQDIIAGHATMGIHDLASIAAGLQGGRLVALAVTGPKRWPALPNLRTFAEQGYPLDIAGWNGIQAPAGTPRPVLERMSAEINKLIQSPEGREQILKYGLLVTGTTPDEFAEIIRRDTPKWGEVIRKAGIKGD
ncbi:MAG: tripartite tricarboxylate transporter substrate binding protein [Burkholderiales bacterium]|nr:tripartite tricarboxylate transporter substrate binding protein [Burkholderiales bacterium]